MGMGLIQDKTTEYLQELLAPFDKPVDCNNINLYFNTPQRRKLPPPHILCREHPDFFDQKGIEFLPDVMVAVGNAMELYKGKNNQEMETSYMVDNVIRKMHQLADKYIGTPEL